MLAIQIKEHFENKGYAVADHEPVDMQIASDEETTSVTIDKISTGWSVQVRVLFLVMYQCSLKKQLANCT